MNCAPLTSLTRAYEGAPTRNGARSIETSVRSPFDAVCRAVRVVPALPLGRHGQRAGRRRRERDQAGTRGLALEVREHRDDPVLDPVATRVARWAHEAHHRGLEAVLVARGNQRVGRPELRRRAWPLGRRRRSVGRRRRGDRSRRRGRRPRRATGLARPPSPSIFGSTRTAAIAATRSPRGGLDPAGDDRSLLERRGNLEGAGGRLVDLDGERDALGRCPSRTSSSA